MEELSEERDEAHEALPWRYPVAIASLTMAMTALMLGAAVWFWWGVENVALGYLIAMVPVSGLAAIMGFAPDPDDPVPRGTRVKMSMVPLVLCGVMGGVAVGSWGTPEVRKETARVLGAQRVGGPLKRCLYDPSAEVAIACCEATRGWAQHELQDVYLAWMTQRPEHHNLCMVSSITPRSGSFILSKLADQWEGELLRASPEQTDAASAEKICARASFVRHFDRAKGVHASIRLARCALDAENHAARQCCAQELRQLNGAGAALSASLPAPEAFANSPQVSMLPRLLHHALAAQGVEGARERRRVAQLGLDTPAVRAWALQSACVLPEHLSNHVRQNVQTRLFTGLANRGCALPSPDRALLQSACDVLHERTGDAAWTAETLCGAIQGQHVASARDHALSVVHVATLRARLRVRPQEDIVKQVSANLTPAQRREFEKISKKGGVAHALRLKQRYGAKTTIHIDQKELAREMKRAHSRQEQQRLLQRFLNKAVRQRR